MFNNNNNRYVSDASPLLPSRFKAVRSTIASWRHYGSLGSFYPLFSTNTVTSRSGGGRDASADCRRPSSLQSTRPWSVTTSTCTLSSTTRTRIFSHKMYQPAGSCSPTCPPPDCVARRYFAVRDTLSTSTDISVVQSATLRVGYGL